MLLFKAYKKTNKNIFYNSFRITKNDRNIIKNTKKDSKKRHVKDIKIFLKKKKRKGEERLEKDIKILLKKKTKKVK